MPEEPGQRCVCAPAVAKKWPHRRTAPARTQPSHASLALTFQSRSAPSPIPARPLAGPSSRSAPPSPSPAPRARTVMAAEWVSLRRSLETGPPFLLVPAGPGAWVPLPTSTHVVSWGSRGRGSRWLPRWLVAFPPLFLCLSLPLSACPVLFAAAGVTDERGLHSLGDRYGGHLRADVCSGLVDLSSAWGEAGDPCSRLQAPKGRGGNL